MKTNLTITAPKLFGAKKAGDKVFIEINRPRLRSAIYLGSGRFTSAYLCGNDVFLYTFYGDHSKDILAQCHSHFKNPHLPRVKHVGSIEYQPWKHAWDVQVYKTAWYYTRPKMSNMSVEATQLVKALRKAHTIACDTVEGHLVNDKKCRKFNLKVADYKGLSVNMQLALEHLALTCTYWGDHYLFDNFRLQNLGLDRRGRLILVDPLFDAEQINNDLKRRMKKWRLRII